jgi:serine-type D-Ala-D-Ala endopeptidase (penicillin-binding protein 7)
VIGLGRLNKKIFALTLVGATLLVPSAVVAQTTAKKTTVKKTTTTTRAAAARARAAAAARARAAAAARAQRAQREADTPKFKTDLLGNLIPDVRAAAAIIYNPQTNEVLWEENSHDARPIASLTKLMTAITFIADEPDLNQKVTVTSADTRAASVTYLRAGEQVSLGDVLHLTLIASDNAAARVLARTSEGGTVAFVRRMNELGTQLGFTSAHFADPSGLDARNVASAYDISHLIAYASADEKLSPVMRKASYEAHTSRRAVTVRSTNRLLVQGMDVVGGKTGFISKAGYCLATLLQIPQGSQVAVVVLGAANSTLRFAEVRHLFNWAVGRTTGLVGGRPGAGLPGADQPGAEMFDR